MLCTCTIAMKYSEDFCQKLPSGVSIRSLWASQSTDSRQDLACYLLSYLDKYLSLFVVHLTVMHIYIHIDILYIYIYIYIQAMPNYHVYIRRSSVLEIVLRAQKCCSRHKEVRDEAQMKGNQGKQNYVKGCECPTSKSSLVHHNLQWVWCLTSNASLRLILTICKR